MNARTSGTSGVHDRPDDDPRVGSDPLGGLSDTDLTADDLADDDLADDDLGDDDLGDDDLVDEDLSEDDLTDDGLIGGGRARADVGDATAVVPTAASGPGVVVVHDWYGPLPHVADFADELTMAGFDVELVDLYDGATTRDPGRAEALAEDLDGDAARDLILTAAKRLRAAGSRNVGVVGFSLGGWLSLGAARSGGFDAVVAYYATWDPAEAAQITCPVQLHLAAQDEFESADDVDAFVAALRAAGTPVDPFTYRGTEHSFANADVELANPSAAEVALARTIGFLHARLAG